MANLSCFSIAGMRLWFYPNDHEPAHFHAKRKGEWEMKVRFQEGSAEMFELVWAAKKKQMSKADREALQEMVKTHRFELLREWEQKVNRS
jgi:uncharacterized protein DUF4160